MIWIFIAGMICGAALLIILILLSDHSFVDLLVNRFAAEPSSAGQRDRSRDTQRQQTMAVGSDS